VRRFALALVGVALVGCGSNSTSTASVHFLGGGRDAFESYVAKQRPKPVVVNKWASWCGPCRAEFPFLRDQANKRKGKVVFVGVNSNDNKGDASGFLADNPLPYRQFEDPNLGIAAAFNGVQAFPTTAFYDSKGKLAFVHAGAYQTEKDMAEDIDRYAR
jgi:cytochrome c biogenesis protein CcmG/thiol:disulfide interchange protein DsbE